MPVSPVEYTHVEGIRAEGQFDNVLASLVESMEGENKAIDFYTRLIAMAPNKKMREVVEYALKDERRHLELFGNVYKTLTGKAPKYKKERQKFSNFKEGISIAFLDELEAYEMYRNIYLMTDDWTIRDVFFRAMTDEIEHATRFSFIYHSL